MNRIKNFLLTLAITTFTINAFSEEVSQATLPAETTISSVALYNEILIDRSLEVIWPELTNFVSWYFTIYADGKIKHIKGIPSQVGYTLEANNTTRHVIISVRPMKSIVWKTCLIASCEDDHVFSDHSLEVSNGKTKFSRNSYSHGFWPEKYLSELRQEQSEKKSLNNYSSKISLAFKEHVENRHNHKLGKE